MTEFIWITGKNSSRLNDVLHCTRKAYKKSRWKRWRARLFNYCNLDEEVSEDA